MNLKFTCSLLIVLIYCLTTLIPPPHLHNKCTLLVSGAEDDDNDYSDDDVGIEDEDDPSRMQPQQPGPASTEQEDQKDDSDLEFEDEDILKKAINIETYMLFTSHPDREITGNSKVSTLIGFQNNAEKSFHVHQLFGSLRHPQDQNYIIENFTSITLHAEIVSQEQAVFNYVLSVSDMYLPRTYGLVIELRYYAMEGEEKVEYGHAVYNGTVHLLEVIETFDTETFFMYVFMVTGIILLAFVLHYAWSVTNSGKKFAAKAVKKPQTAAETVSPEEQEKRSDVDFNWISKDALMQNNKKSGRGGKSPKPKKNSQSENL